MIYTIKKLYFNLINSINGLKLGLKEHSFLIEIIGGFILLPYVFISNMEEFYKISIIIVYLLLLAFELINSSIEKLSDKITKSIDSDIKTVKDLSSSAVFIVLMLLIFLIIISLWINNKGVEN